MLPAEETMGIYAERDTIEVSRKDATELDLVALDVRKFFLLLLKANGCVLEQLYSHSSCTPHRNTTS